MNNLPVISWTAILVVLTIGHTQATNPDCLKFTSMVAGSYGYADPTEFPSGFSKVSGQDKCYSSTSTKTQTTHYLAYHNVAGIGAYWYLGPAQTSHGPCLTAVPFISLGTYYKAQDSDPSNPDILGVLNWVDGTSSPANGIAITDCASSGTVEGDPHFLTYDGLRYDFQGTCEYLLTGYVPQQEHEQPRLPPFQVYTKNRVVGKNVYIRYHRVVFGDDEVSMFQGKFIKINDGRVEPGQTRDYGHFQISRNNTWLSVQTNFGLSVFFTGRAKLSVSVSPQYDTLLQGLLGDKDGLPTNDLRHRDGALLTEDQACYFADSWRSEGCDPTPCSPGPNAVQTAQPKKRKDIRKKFRFLGY